MTARPWTVTTLLLLGLSLIAGAPAAAADDRYLAGYAAAILEHQLQLPGRALTVQNGVVTVDLAGLDPARRDGVLAALSAIAVVTEVRPAAAPTSPTAGGTAAAPAGQAGPGPAARPSQVGVLPGGQLFNPLIANPRWPHFSVSYQRYLDAGQLRNVGAGSFGETFSVYRDHLGPGFWEIGPQAGVFAFFNLDAPSMDLINADYFVALMGGYRLDRVSALARLSHTE